MSVLLEGEGNTPDNFLRVKVTPKGVVFDIYDENKGKTRITISKKEWNELEKYVDRESEHSVSVLLEGEGNKPDNFLRVKVTRKRVVLDIYDENKGRNGVFISKGKWSEMAKYVKKEFEKFQDPEKS